jgi:hypothetical protein
MHIYVSGQSKSTNQQEITQAVEIFGELTLGKRRANATSVYVRAMEMPKPHYGYCVPLDSTNRRRRVFGIFVNDKLTKKKTIMTLAHEMVHVRQMRLNVLRSVDSTWHKWFGRPISVHNREYRQLPWEIEAFVCEEPMYKHYLAVTKRHEQQMARSLHANARPSSNRRCSGS